MFEDVRVARVIDSLILDTMIKSVKREYCVVLVLLLYIWAEENERV